MTKQRSSALLPHNLRENPQLARALVAENQLTSGLSQDEHDRVKSSLLTDDDEAKLREVELADRQISAAEKAYSTATEVLGELAQLSEGELQMFEAGAQLTPDENPTKDLPISKGGSLKIVTDEEDNQ